MVVFAVSVDVLGKTNVGTNLSATTSFNDSMYLREKYWSDESLSPLSMIVVVDGGILEA